MKRIICLLIIVILYSCKSDSNEKTQNPNDNIIIGKKLRYTSKILNEERELFISLPKNYNQNIHKYPVIIVMDGEYLFEITNSIVKIKTSRNEMPESIIVGIPNNTGKRAEMSLELIKKDGNKFFGNYGGNAKEYLDFISKEIIPFLENKYRVNSHKTIIGMSPTFGPVLEAFWNNPELFSGYIVLAAELSLKTKPGETVAQKLQYSIQDSLRPQSSIYIGKASDDLKRRPPEEAEAFAAINQELETKANPKINYTIEILENENHYGMSISGIEHGLETIYPPQIWNIPYREFWKSENPANEIKLFYQNLSEKYGFKIIPLEDSFYYGQTLLGTVRRLERQKKIKELKDVIELGLNYYPNSEELKKARLRIK